MSHRPPFTAHLVTFCTVFVLASGIHARAQGIEGGLRAGPTFGFLNDNPVPFNRTGDPDQTNTNVRLGGHVSGFLVVPVTKRWAFQPELLFVQKGGHLSRFGERHYSSERYRFSYLQGQLLARRSFSLAGPLSLHAVGGLTVDRALEAVVRRNIRAEAFLVEERIRLLDGDLIERWDLGGLLGVGVEYPVGSASHVALTVRYNPGFRRIFTETRRPVAKQESELQDPPPLTHSPPTLRHDVIMVGLSYTFSRSR